jgi:hypothetical protein
MPWLKGGRSHHFKNAMGWILTEWRRRRREERRFRESFTPMDQFEAEDIFIVGYPKSGNTWFQDLVATLIFGVNPAYTPPSVALDLVPELRGKYAYYRRHMTPTFFKSHEFPRPDHRRVVYLMRDGRDVMVSYYHYLKAFGGSADLLEMIQKGRSGNLTVFGKWHEHVNAWMANPYQAQMMVIKFEDLKRDTAGELARFCAFAGLKREPAFLEMVARETVFEKMQNREILMGQGDPKWPRDKLFHRRGVVGSYKDEMPPEVLQAFMAEGCDTLKKFGYV